MSDYMISIPDELYEKALRVARETSRQVEEVIRTRLEDTLNAPSFDLPEDEREELKAMAYLSDDTLWTIAREQMPKVVQDRMAGLMTNNNFGTITDDEYTELAALVERGNRLMLRKAQAMQYLMDRGYTITLDDLKPSEDSEAHV